MGASFEINQIINMKFTPFFFNHSIDVHINPYKFFYKENFAITFLLRVNIKPNVLWKPVDLSILCFTMLCPADW